MVGDPDDHRPETRWATVCDPGGPAGRVDDLVAVVEHIAVGDRIPMHVHDVSELIFVHGPGRQRLGDEELTVTDGSIVFVPRGIPHGLTNDGDLPLRIEAVFPSDRIRLRYLERNAAPGTDNDPIGPPITLIVRTGEVIVDDATGGSPS
jgi:quercetin dioxygenase-like cupin family protein